MTYPRCRVLRTDLQLFLLKKLKVKYLIISEEKHEDGEPHLHAYVQLLNKCDFRSPNCLDYDGCHGNYQVAKGTYDQNMEYLTKEDKEPLEWGIPDKFAGDRSKETIAGIKEKNKKIINGDLLELVNNGDIYIGNYLSIKKNVCQYKMDSITIGQYREIECKWIWGVPGVGKSRWVRDNYKQFYTKPQNKWWDGYKQEHVVLLDDFDKQGECLSHYIKIWSDVYTFYGEIKGGTVPCAYNTFIITSNYQPSDIWTDRTLVDAITRRFEVIELTSRANITP